MHHLCRLSIPRGGGGERKGKEENENVGLCASSTMLPMVQYIPLSPPPSLTPDPLEIQILNFNHSVSLISFFLEIFRIFYVNPHYIPISPSPPSPTHTHVCLHQIFPNRRFLQPVYFVHGLAPSHLSSVRSVCGGILLQTWGN